jgi:hypothetical protein
MSALASRCAPAVQPAVGDRPGMAQRAATDSSVMEGYGLTVEERQALLSRDKEALARMGVSGDLLAAVGDVAGGKR